MVCSWVCVCAFTCLCQKPTSVCCHFTTKCVNMIQFQWQQRCCSGASYLWLKQSILMWNIKAIVTCDLKCFIFPSNRATIEEVEGDVCELESKLDKVSTTHEKHCLIVHLFCCVILQRPSCEWKVAGLFLVLSPAYCLGDCFLLKLLK